MMHLKSLILLFGVVTGLANASVGALVGDWWQNHPDKALGGENHAISQPIDQDTERFQVTLGVKGHGDLNSVEFFLVVSSRENNASCLYTVEEIAIDSLVFPVSSTAHRSDIDGIRAVSAEQQNQLWQGFRQGKTLSLILNQACADATGTLHESHQFEFSLKGSNAAYHFVTGLKPPQKAVKPKQKANEPVKPPKVVTHAEPGTDSSDLSPYFILAIALVTVLLLVSRMKRQAKHMPREINPAVDNSWNNTNRGRHAQNNAAVESATEAFRASRGVTEKSPTQPTSSSRPAATITLALSVANLPTYKVERVIDGDTVAVSNQRRQLRVRLDAIDCPEDGQEWGDIATAGLIKLIGGKHIQLEEHGTDRYERMLATLYVRSGSESEWMNVNERMVTLGHAWVMRRFYKHLSRQRQDKLNQLERWAKGKKVGLWKTANPIPPWEWRNGG
ncbi:thermonuclease family protein [Gammaproteobacteria bacterium]|nr:thermonuclease family protein [Gammaproteobacteria bacterium]